MKSAFRPFFFLIALVLIVGLACSFAGGANAPAQPEQPAQPVQTEQPVQPTQEQIVQPTLPPPPTKEPATQAPPPPPPQAAKFFTQEFDTDPGDDWEFWVIGTGADRHEDKATYEFDFGQMIVTLDEADLYAYYTYEAELYENVRLDINFENRGVNSQNISLVCRLSDDGWYEFSIGSDGLWQLYAYVDGYNLVASGGSNAIRQGKEENEYSMVCDDDTIALFINGEELRGSPFTERKYALRRGGVGFNISSLSAFPVKVEIDWFKISEP